MPLLLSRSVFWILSLSLIFPLILLLFIARVQFVYDLLHVHFYAFVFS